jgi:hypothetical protein
VPEETFRVNVTLAAEYAEKLTRLAERTHVRVVIVSVEDGRTGAATLAR